VFSQFGPPKVLNDGFLGTVDSTKAVVIPIDNVNLLCVETTSSE
jgi:hypothetical protein